jgi:hypothetical protein
MVSGQQAQHRINLHAQVMSCIHRQRSLRCLSVRLNASTQVRRSRQYGMTTSSLRIRNPGAHRREAGGSGQR